MLISLEPYGRFKVHLNRCSVTAKLWVSIAVSLAQCLAGVTMLIKPTILHVIQVLHAGNLGQMQVFSRVLFQFPSTVHSQCTAPSILPRYFSSLERQRCLPSAPAGNSLICSCPELMSTAFFPPHMHLRWQATHVPWLSSDSVKSQLRLRFFFCAVYCSFPWVVDFVLVCFFFLPEYIFQQWVKIPLAKRQNLLP